MTLYQKIPVKIYIHTFHIRIVYRSVTFSPSSQDTDYFLTAAKNYHISCCIKGNGLSEKKFKELNACRVSVLFIRLRWQRPSRAVQSLLHVTFSLPLSKKTVLIVLSGAERTTPWGLAMYAGAGLLSWTLRRVAISCGPVGGIENSAQ